MKTEKGNLFFKCAPGTVCLPKQSPYQPSSSEADPAATSRPQGGGRAAPPSCLSLDQMQGRQLLGAGEGGAATLRFARTTLGVKDTLEMGIRFLRFFFQASICYFQRFLIMVLLIPVIQLQPAEQIYLLHPSPGPGRWLWPFPALWTSLPDLSPIQSYQLYYSCSYSSLCYLPIDCTTLEAPF